MAELNQLPKVVNTPKKRVGRGNGSNKGKTSGRGMKGQRARGKVRVGFEGGQTPLVRRIPFYRGRGFSGKGQSVTGVNLSEINQKYDKGEVVNLASLRKKGLVARRSKHVKILGKGKLTREIQFSQTLEFTKVAEEKIALLLKDKTVKSTKIKQKITS